MRKFGKKLLAVLAAGAMTIGAVPMTAVPVVAEDTAAASTAEQESEYPINLEIGTNWAMPGYGSENQISVSVTSDGTISAASYGMHFMLEFPESTAELLDFPDNWEPDYSFCYGFGVEHTNATANFYDQYVNAEWIVPANKNAAVDPTAVEAMFTLSSFEVPDADTVKAVAEKYGISLQTGEYNGETVQYYAFPMNFADRDTTYIKYSGDKEVTIHGFEYLDDTEKSPQNIMDQVGLQNGFINIIIPEETETTTTAAVTTTVSTSTTTTTTTTTAPVTIVTTVAATTAPAVSTATEAAAATTVISTEKSDAVDASSAAAESISTSTTTTTAAGSKVVIIALYGDLNLDGKVALSDAVLLSKATADVVILTDTARDNGDCNEDGVTDGTDVIILLHFLVGILDKLPQLPE